MKLINKVINESDTLYAIKTVMSKDYREISIGKLGSFHFSEGYYVYVGSAKRNILARVNRHIQIDKKKRWHMDYLRPYVQILDIQTYSGEEGECGLFKRLMNENSGIIPAKGFGSSDCKCISHLFYSQKEVILDS